MIEIPGYKVIKLIGQGGMASVYLATQESVGRDVAVKVMSQSLSSDPTFSERFVKEARTGSLIHPHIISVFDAGEIDGQNYIIMEYANGGNLDTAIKQGLDLKRIIEIISEIASALHYSATKGFIHRDVKPENILIREDGSAILVDFGIAKAITAGTKLTMVGSTIGSPNYMSPEQARGLPLDGRSDLYSLGIVLFETLTGAKPYDAEDTFVIGLKHINEPVPTLPKKFSAFQPIIDKLLAKSPDDRFNNGQELIEALKKITIQDNQATNNPSLPPLEDNKTVIAPTAFQQQETHEIPVDSEITQIDDSTRIQATQESDQTQVRTNSYEQTVVRPLPKTAIVREKKNNVGLFVTLFITVGAMAGGGFWYWQSHTEEIPKTVEAIPAEKTPLPIKPSIVEAPPSIPDTAQPITKVSKEKTQQDLILKLLEKAQNAVKAKRYTTPDKDNAFYYFEEILALDKQNQAAIDGIKDLAVRYLKLANRQFNKKAYEPALRFIDKGLFVEPDNRDLVTLRDKIYDLQQQEKEQQLKFLANHKTPLKQEKNITTHIGKHISNNKSETFWFARQDLVNRLYNQILKQCNNSSQAFNHEDCILTYERFIKQWPLPILGSTYRESIQSTDITGEISLSKNKSNTTYQKLLNHYRLEFKKGIETDFSNKKSLISLANYDLHTAIAPLFGLPTSKDIHKRLNETIEKFRVEKSITKVDDLVNYVNKTRDEQKIHIRPFTAKNSSEITPFAQTLHQALNTAIETADIENAELHVLGEYEITPTGNYKLDLWLFNQESQVVDLQALTLDARLAAKKRSIPYLYNSAIFPKTKLEKANGFPSELSIGNQTANALLQVGEKVDLKVKLDGIGFYYIAVHVRRANEEFSYLLPLHNAEVPFVQVTTRKFANRFVTLGSFNITPPIGVEALQLVAASVNLEKYLPNYHWDTEKNQFIINDSVGNIEKGIRAIREKANTINANSHKNDIHWQEKLLVTSILER